MFSFFDMETCCFVDFFILAFFELSDVTIEFFSSSFFHFLAEIVFVSESSKKLILHISRKKMFLAEMEMFFFLSFFSFHKNVNFCPLLKINLLR